MELKEAINNLNFIIVTDVYDNEVRIDKTKVVNEYNESVGVVLQHLAEQEKMIELLIKHICDVIDNDDGACLLPFYDSDENLEEKVRQYFEKKAEEIE